MMKLFFEFLKVGMFSFGGAYSAIPLIKDLVIQNGFITLEQYIDMVAVAESTPGPLMVNLATYVGLIREGTLGSVVATLAVIVPSFVIIIIFAIYSSKILNNKKVSFVLSVIRPAIIAVIFIAGIDLLFKNVLVSSDFTMLTDSNFFINIINDVKIHFDDFFKKVIIIIALLSIKIYYKKHTNKKLNSILFLVISAIFGICIFTF